MYPDSCATLAAAPQPASEVVQPRPRDSGCMDISVGPDVLQTAVSVTTVVSEKWMEIDTPDAVVSGMEVAGGSPPADIYRLLNEYSVLGPSSLVGI